MILKRTCLSLVILATIPFSTNANTGETLNAQFKSAYYSYQKSLETNDRNAQFKHAEAAYLLGKQLYGEKDINTANLALILAREHLQNNQEEQAEQLLLTTLNIFKSKYGENAIELAEIFILLGQSALFKVEKEINYYLDALAIAKDHEEELPYVNAQIQLDAGAALLRLGSRKSDVILAAQKYLTENLPENDKRVVSANFWAGRYYLARKKYNKAIDFFEANLRVFESLDGVTHPLELSTHAFLIDALENTGKSDQATKHCIAIGSMTPWLDDQEQTPLFRRSPKYPINYARKGKSGWVDIGFTVNEFGMVLEPKILASNGGHLFEKSALAAIETWRYAPKFEDGKPIQAYTTVRLDFKMAE
ncbi:TonB family protein [Thalassotalea ponticola]|uniref:TonB family protein n=1 Tax=Thalassotalea ponticola TaxID=1523392 RepID=UPI0025B49824|nr:TonB family protein [Thalassotalea ponticola]MDN3652229.1 TonB family protein [Thalassotalea ponticola]